MFPFQFAVRNFTRLDRNVPALLSELETPSILTDKDSIVKSADTIGMENHRPFIFLKLSMDQYFICFLALEMLLEKLTQAKDDEQQRNWMLYEDEHSILSMLRSLNGLLQVGTMLACF